MRFDLKKYISGFDLKKVLDVEHSDKQFLALKKTWEKINKPIPNPSFNKVGKIDEINKELFLLLILQNALVSYQIAGGGELRWAEFASKIVMDWEILKKLHLAGKDNIGRWYKFLTSSKYNKRIYNIKAKRLKKFDKFLAESRKQKAGSDIMQNYYENMEKLLADICEVMGNSKDSKTMVFAVKMFGYGARVVFEKLIYYPMSIGIPVDSRIKKIFEMSSKNSLKIVQKSSKKQNDLEIQKYFQKLAEEFNIPPLHLDSLLWVKK